MATSREFVPARREAGEEIEPQRSVLGIPSKSYVVGRYNELGRVLVNGSPVDGPQAVSRHRQLLLESMSGRGNLMPGYVMTENGPVKQTMEKKASQVPVPKSKGKPKKGKAAVDYMQVVNTPLLHQLRLLQPSINQRRRALLLCLK